MLFVDGIFACLFRDGETLAKALQSDEQKSFFFRESWNHKTLVNFEIFLQTLCGKKSFRASFARRGVFFWVFESCEVKSSRRQWQWKLLEFMMLSREMQNLLKYLHNSINWRLWARLLTMSDSDREALALMTLNEERCTLEHSKALLSLNQTFQSTNSVCSNCFCWLRIQLCSNYFVYRVEPCCSISITSGLSVWIC